MSAFQVLCVTMHQRDFSKIREMNLHSDVVFANQAERTGLEEIVFDGHTAKMITTNTRGVGINRNLALMYADAEICLFADDDVVYLDGMEQLVVDEFKAHPDADIMVFHLNSDDSERRQVRYPKTKKCGRIARMPWGSVRIAFRLDAVRKANLWYTTLFGGGCRFPSGEDSMWLHDAKKKGLTFYVSEKTIGRVSYQTSTWYTGRDEKYFYGRGAYEQAVHPKTRYFWMLYFSVRVKSGLSWAERLKWMKCGTIGYRQMLSYEAFRERRGD